MFHVKHVPFPSQATSLAWSKEARVLGQPFPNNLLAEYLMSHLILGVKAQLNAWPMHHKHIVQHREIVVQQAHHVSLGHSVGFARIQVAFLVVRHLVGDDKERLPMVELAYSLHSGQDLQI